MEVYHALCVRRVRAVHEVWGGGGGMARAWRAAPWRIASAGRLLLRRSLEPQVNVNRNGVLSLPYLKTVKFKNGALGVFNYGVFNYGVFNYGHPQGHYTEHEKVAADSN